MSDIAKRRSRAPALGATHRPSPAVEGRSELSPQEAGILRWQQLAGNAAVAQMLAGRREGASLQREPQAPEAAGESEAAVTGRLAAVRVLIPAYSNADLMAKAQRLNDELLARVDEVGPLARSAIAETLIEMHRELDRRIQEASAKQVKFPPVLEGIRWRPDDPLAGIVEGISPFHMIDWWGAFAPTGAQPKGASRGARAAPASRPTPSPGVPAAARTPEGEAPVQAPRRAREVIKGQIGKPKEIGSDTKKWWKNIGTPSPDPEKVFRAVVTQLAANWINALRAGTETSARRFCLMVVAEGIASMAARILNDAIRKIIDPESGLPMYIYGTVPEPTDARIAAALEASVRRWRAPSDRIALALGRKRGLQIARNIVNELDGKTSGGGVRYLVALKRAFNGNQQAIYDHMYREIKAAGVTLTE